MFSIHFITQLANCLQLIVHKNCIQTQTTIIKNVLIVFKQWQRRQKVMEINLESDEMDEP